MLTEETMNTVLSLSTKFTIRQTESDTSVYVLLYMLDGGESDVTDSAAVCAAPCAAEYAADLV